MEGRPFAIIGVNGDNLFQQVQEVTAKGRIPWPSIKNERAGGRVAVSEEWNLRRWPTFPQRIASQIRFNSAATKADKGVMPGPQIEGNMRRLLLLAAVLAFVGLGCQSVGEPPNNTDPPHFTGIHVP